ncbi:MAG TPA: MoaD/ThiS family protein [Acidobacteriaceae bacterium]|nr:MoaD/ThiS family protein [Acidobacteriaceae bacterium]
MRVKVLYFGVLKDYFGDSADAGLPEGASVAELLRQHEDLANVEWKSIAVAVNRDYAKLTDVLHEGDEVALLPPVSGGCGEYHRRHEQSEILRYAQNDKYKNVRLPLECDGKPEDDAD